MSNDRNLVSEQNPAKKVFLSHATEDKQRFVLPFATALRARGVDVWVDRWEMLPGDSLVDKIFEEGLKSASAVIVVLSANSVQKRWVREELNAATIKRVTTGTKLIPVVIDDCDIPESLKTIVWERVADLSRIEETVERVVAAVHDVRNKPAMGSPPAYSSAIVHEIPGLNQTDGFVLKVSCEKAISVNDLFVQPSETFRSGTTTEIPEPLLTESLEILDQQGFIKLHRVLAPGPHTFQITTYGLDKYLRAYFPGYDKLIRDVAISLVNHDLTENQAIAKSINQPIVLVDHAFDLLEGNGHIRQSKLIGGVTHVYHVAPSLKRALS